MSNLHLPSVHQLGYRFLLHSRKSFTNYSSGQCHLVISISSQSLSAPTKLSLSTFTAQPNRQRDSDGKPPPLFTKTESQAEGIRSISGTQEEPHVTNVRKILKTSRLDLKQPLPDAENIQPVFGRNIVTLKMNFEKEDSGTGLPGKGDEGNRSEDESLMLPTTCCLSGCHNCVWIEYVERLSKHYSDPNIGREKIREDINSIPDANIRAVLIMELKFRGLW